MSYIHRLYSLVLAYIYKMSTVQNWNFDKLSVIQVIIYQMFETLSRLKVVH